MGTQLRTLPIQEPVPRRGNPDAGFKRLVAAVWLQAFRDHLLVSRSQRAYKVVDRWEAQGKNLWGTKGAICGPVLEKTGLTHSALSRALTARTDPPALDFINAGGRWADLLLWVGLDSDDIDRAVKRDARRGISLGERGGDG